MSKDGGLPTCRLLVMVIMFDEMVLVVIVIGGQTKVRRLTTVFEFEIVMFQ